MAAAPLVTVLLAVRDGERYLRSALGSALGQTVADLELLVVDDASSDATPEILEEIADTRLRVLRNDKRAIVTAASQAKKAAEWMQAQQPNAEEAQEPAKLAA